MSDAKKSFLWLALALVIALLVALLFVVRSGPEEVARVNPPPVREVERAPERAAAPEAPPVRRAERPLTPPTPEPVEPVQTVRDDGTVVRDHRRWDPAQEAAVEKGEEPPPKAVTQPTLVLATRRAIQPVVRACASKHAGALGESPNINVEVEVTVSERQLFVRKTTVGLTNVQEGQINQCITEGLRDFSVPAPDNEDVTSHRLTFPFDL